MINEQGTTNQRNLIIKKFKHFNHDILTHFVWLYKLDLDSLVFFVFNYA